MGTPAKAIIVTGNNSLRILYVWEWGAGSGHLRRFQPLAEHLRRAGHEVTIASRDIVPVVSLFPSAHFRWLSAPTPSPPAFPAEPACRNPLNFAQLALNLGMDDGPKVEAIVGIWIELIRLQQPDLVIADFGLAGQVAAAALQIPCVRLGTGYTCPPAGESPVAMDFAMQSRDRDDVQQAELDASRLIERLNVVVSKFGIRRQVGWRDVLLDDSRTLLATVPPLDPYADSRGTNSYQGFWDSPGQYVPSWPAGTPRRVVAYLKPFRQLPAFVQSLHSIGANTLLVGDKIPPTMLRGLASSRIESAPAPVNLQRLSGRCDAILCNANHGTTLRALSLGIPVITVPLFLEQRITAETIHRQGWGVNVNPHQPHEFASEIEHVFAPDTFAKAQEFAVRYGHDAEGGLVRAIDKLEKVLG